MINNNKKENLEKLKKEIAFIIVVLSDTFDFIKSYYKEEFRNFINSFKRKK